MIPEKELLWAYNKSFKIPLYALDPSGLILLERHGLKLKVGDDIEVVALSSIFIQKMGKIIVIDPKEDGFSFLVEFNCEWGHDASLSWKKNWYPKKYKVPAKNRYWFREDQLQVIKGEVV